MVEWDWELTGFRIGAFFSMILVALVFGILPYLFQRFVFRSADLQERLLSLGNSFAGGLFLGGGLMHLLAESVRTFDHELGEDYEPYPFAMMLLPVGFFLVFFIEKVLLSHDPKVITVGGQKEKEEEYGTFPPTTTGPVASTGILVAEDDALLKPQPENAHEPIPDAPPAETTSTVKAHGHEHGHGHDHEHDDDHDHHSHFLMMVKDPSSLVPYILVIVLSAHAVISGIAVGVQDSVSAASPVFIAVMSHKWVESFALGVNLLKGGLSTRTSMKLLAAFSLTEPVGVLIGAALSVVLTGFAGKMLTASCAALASGTFVYVAVCDILLVEFETGRDKYAKFALAILGLLVMASMLLAFPDEHDG